MSDPILSIRDLKMHFPVKGGVLSRQVAAVKAVDGVTLDVGRGETLGLVGESGCGKSTLGKSIVRLTNPTSGSIEFQGKDITKLTQSQLRPIRRNLQMVFQDPAESLNSRMSVGQIISEPLEVQKIGTRATRRDLVEQLLDRVGMPKSASQRFSFEFSGGQRQRIGIARALALNPELIVLDEPVSALDVSVQSQVLNLLLDLQEEMNLAYLFIAHDLAVVKHISDRVAVMYLGKIVELADADAIYKNPKHAYTKALISAIPEPDPDAPKDRVHLEGEIPSPINPPAGSAFGHRIQHPRYEETIGMDLGLVELEKDHWVAADPCCLTDDDYEKARALKSSAV
ncbi:ATP-binding cassette domain-containing protein [Verrucomicrobiaceae bacterium R5-34]|uniref:ATP-binding cassette domain-containing protein n=1 Tax=Oceaniferula flava TaxID=2800421 RepID=A0AAE2S948_9BACT|nr:oligopeptide/dipeptide ABC transporter ATP-binding protein [Oceaniferula flavus]MBK1829253.1 ATP-binding cassette domain-containing protein [Verrucomicrobiaceae bacterium R5-34]MBK1853490.1 ATP-binding cassette domain-containing protein [Oceaniferula flavus]MBM1134795.1 ATP-binding cassette domain-containing protein [Oceaniferula flavus]